jgi:D-alanyl-D-alanine carboxypeptidase (penicillin-binding protein 5/6)
MRAQESLKLLNFGFQFYDAVKLYAKDQAVSHLKVWKGAQKTRQGRLHRGFHAAVPKGMAGACRPSLVSRQPLIAPVQQGQVVGTHEGRASTASPSASTRSSPRGVPVAGIFGRAMTPSVSGSTDATFIP